MAKEPLGRTLLSLHRASNGSYAAVHSALQSIMAFVTSFSSSATETLADWPHGPPTRVPIALNTFTRVPSHAIESRERLLCATNFFTAAAFGLDQRGQFSAADSAHL